jgi:hypothetical protein
VDVELGILQLLWNIPGSPLKSPRGPHARTSFYGKGVLKINLDLLIAGVILKPEPSSINIFAKESSRSDWGSNNPTGSEVYAVESQYPRPSGRKHVRIPLEMHAFLQGLVHVWVKESVNVFKFFIGYLGVPIFTTSASPVDRLSAALVRPDRLFGRLCLRRGVKNTNIRC